MKRFTISIFLIILALSVCFVETVYLENSLNTISEKVNILKSNVRENKTISQKDTDEILNYWKERSKFLMHFIDRDKLYSLTKEIAELENCKFFSQQQLLIVINDIEDVIYDLRRSQKLYIKNAL